MSAKEPVLLVVLVETANLRWFVAGIDLAGSALPLLRSEVGNLGAYLDLAFDEQASFLRHRLSGVLQRGCDRLWGRQKKPCQIVFLADGQFVRAAPELTGRVAEHFVEWMTSPPVVFFTCSNGFAAGEPPVLNHVAGNIEGPHREALQAGLAASLAAMNRLELWELTASKPPAEDCQPRT